MTSQLCFLRHLLKGETVGDDDESKDDASLEKELLPIGSQFGESSSRLLSARRSLLNRRHKNEN